ncbi:hypothetical protein FGO68_gene7266 [Halteria grandinella]|uniref:Uncharacterized protein n=1 Tax=Halteria grandinella TaxID=5974 RepID=A0A8J8SWD5_HALGN|nr:hypothetical protein FGO68_gene7266 [Halteria grandinella]
MSFLNSKDIPQSLLKIRKFINRAHMLAYDEVPDHNAFRQDLIAATTQASTNPTFEDIPSLKSFLLSKGLSNQEVLSVSSFIEQRTKESRNESSTEGESDEESKGHSNNLSQSGDRNAFENLEETVEQNKEKEHGNEVQFNLRSYFDKYLASKQLIADLERLKYACNPYKLALQGKGIFLAVEQAFLSNPSLTHSSNAKERCDQLNHLILTTIISNLHLTPQPPVPFSTHSFKLSLYCDTRFYQQLGQLDITASMVEHIKLTLTDSNDAGRQYMSTLTKMGKAYGGFIQVAAGREYVATVQIGIQRQRAVEAKMLKVAVKDAIRNIRVKAQSGHIVIV